MLLIALGIGGDRTIVAVPGIDRGLQPVADGEKLTVARHEIPDEAGEAGPEPIGRDTGTGQRFALHEINQHRIDLKPRSAHKVSHE